MSNVMVVLIVRDECSESRRRDLEPNRFLKRHCARLTEWFQQNRHQPDLKSFLRRAEESAAGHLGTPPNLDQLWDWVSQTLVQTRTAWRLHPAARQAVAGNLEPWPAGESLPLVCLRWGTVGQPPSLASLWEEVAAVLDAVDQDVSVCLASQDFAGPNATAHAQGHGAAWDFDQFLGKYDPRGRARHGVFFTPRPLADLVVSQTDVRLREEFQLADGLADRARWSEVVPVQGLPSGAAVERGSSPFIRILDPAAGTGVFLLAATQLAQRTLAGRWDEWGWTVRARQEEWNAFVDEHWLRQVAGRELLLPAYCVAWIRWTDQLAALGYAFNSPLALPLDWGDSLRGPPAESSAPVTVLVGNPPFSALTTTQSEWTRQLQRQSRLGSRDVGHYYEVDGQPLGERKLWLHDDYVQFLRHAQWHIEQSGAGIVAYVTNHGYLDHLTFRGVRRSLLRSFPRISVLDLHGGRKNREAAPAGIADQNLFGIDQGVAVTWLRRPPSDLATNVERADLWGSINDKLSRLAEWSRSPPGIPWHAMLPEAPRYLFAENRSQPEVQREYQTGFALDEILPIHSSAAVTARDAFVVAFTREELCERMVDFISLERSDEWVRRTYFSHTRSRRYPSGDSRSWKLPEARNRARELTPEQRELLIRRCCYRPFDSRWILWADWMVDWPRTQAMQHMIELNNVALVTRRQIPADEPAQYVFAADGIVLDGLIRSDNRGSETFFPLFLVPECGEDSPRVNLKDGFRAVCARHAQQGHEPASLECLAMIYAQLHSSEYRRRYQPELTVGFPRIRVPRSAELFWRLVELGRRLLSCHLLRSGTDFLGRGEMTVDDFLGPPLSLADDPIQLADTAPLPARGWPRWQNEQIEVTPGWAIPHVPRTHWEFRVGSHQVCRKWVRDRTGQCWEAATRSRYARIVNSVADSVSLAADVDLAIDMAGGWSNAFLSR